MLDTDTASYVIKGKSSEVASKLSEVNPANICISAVTRAELLYGLKKLPPDHRLQETVRQFFALVRCLPWSAEAATHYADIRHLLTTTGQPIGEMDMMIAAHALAMDAVLVTNNARHFGRIPSLALINWARAPRA